VWFFVPIFGFWQYGIFVVEAQRWFLIASAYRRYPSGRKKPRESHLLFRRYKDGIWSVESSISGSSESFRVSTWSIEKE